MRTQHLKARDDNDHPADDRSEDVARRLGTRLQVGYVAALLLIATITLGSHLLISEMLSANTADATTVNLAGRQRMLSQRIVKDVLLARAGVGEPGEVLDKLDADLTSFRSVHSGLREGDPERNILGPGRAVVGLVFPPTHDAYLRFERAATTVLAELAAGGPTDSLHRLLAAEVEFLPRMDALVQAYEDHSTAKLGRMRSLHLASAFALLLVLLAEAMFLFRPAVRKIRKQVFELALAQERTQLLATAAEHTRHAVVLGDARGSIAWVNPAAEEAFASCEADIPTLADVAPGPAAGRIRDAIDAGADLHLEDVAGGGSSYAVDLVAVRSAGGAARRYVLVVTDLSERARRERDRQDVQRRAGRADIAVSVLHNVGNTLNSLSLAASAADRHLQETRMPGLARALELLGTDPAAAARFLAEDPRGAKLPPYLHDLCGRLQAEQDALREELRGVLEGVEHLRHVVREESACVGETDRAREEAMEEMEAQTLVDEAVRLYGGSAIVEGIEVLRVPSDEPLHLRVDRHAALQVLGNLLTNAVRATRQRVPAPAAPPPITFAVEGSGDGFARILVVDRGIGFEAKGASRMFQPGFSTKPGSNGIGLPASANAASAMGGRLIARSDGPDRGAAFSLELPLAASSPSRSTGAMREAA